MKRVNSLWISWDWHRRSHELADALNVQHLPLISPDHCISARIVRYIILSWRTICLLLSTRPLIVFCQNPSVVLAALLGLLKRACGYRLFVDRHSNFKLNQRSGVKYQLFHLISNFSIRSADLTIVTNDHLAHVVNELKGRSFVLQDRLPTLNLAEYRELNVDRSVFCVSTFSRDEPFIEIVNAARVFDANTIFFVSGNYRNLSRANRSLCELPSNMVLTGYLPEAEYQSLMASCDIVLVLTTEEYLLTCGAYEATSLGIPMVLSDTMTIRGYFQKGAVYTKPDAFSIAIAIREAFTKKEKLKLEVDQLRIELSREWENRFSRLKSLVGEISSISLDDI